MEHRRYRWSAFPTPTGHSWCEPMPPSFRYGWSPSRMSSNCLYPRRKWRWLHAPKQHDPEQPRLWPQPSSSSTTRSTAIVVDACLFGDFMCSGSELAIWDEEEASAMG